MAYSKEEGEKFVELCINNIKNIDEGNIIKFFEPDEVCISDDSLSTDVYVTVKEKDMNAIGSTHGAFIAGFLDHWIGVSSRIFGGIDHEKTGLTTADYQLNFLSATKVGDKLRCHIECCHAGKRSIVTRSIVYCGDKVVAIATQNMAVISPTVYINSK